MFSHISGDSPMPGVIAALFLILLAGSAGAAPLPGRYVFEKVEEGYLRLDTETGRISLCAAAKGVWSCTAVPDDMAALAAENERLKERLQELEKSRFSLDLPSDQDVDKLLDIFGKMVDKFVEFSRRIDRQGTI